MFIFIITSTNIFDNCNSDYLIFVRIGKGVDLISDFQHLRKPLDPRTDTIARVQIQLHLDKNLKSIVKSSVKIRSNLLKEILLVYILHRTPLRTHLML